MQSFKYFWKLFSYPLKYLILPFGLEKLLWLWVLPRINKVICSNSTMSWGLHVLNRCFQDKVQNKRSSSSPTEHIKHVNDSFPSCVQLGWMCNKSLNVSQWQSLTLTICIIRTILLKYNIYIGFLKSYLSIFIFSNSQFFLNNMSAVDCMLIWAIP